MSWKVSRVELNFYQQHADFFVRVVLGFFREKGEIRVRKYGAFNKLEH